MAPIPFSLDNFLGCCFDLRFFSKTKFKNAKQTNKQTNKQTKINASLFKITYKKMTGTLSNSTFVM